MKIHHFTNNKTTTHRRTKLLCTEIIVLARRCAIHAVHGQCSAQRTSLINSQCTSPDITL